MTRLAPGVTVTWTDPDGDCTGVVVGPVEQLAGNNSLREVPEMGRWWITNSTGTFVISTSDPLIWNLTTTEGEIAA